MEVTLDELRKNDVDIDMTTLSYRIHHCLEQYQTMYEQMAIHVDPVDLPEIFDDMNVNNIGRSIAFLTYVYVLKGSEDVARRAVRLVATVLKDMDLTPFKVEGSYFQRMLSGIRGMLTL